MMSMYKKWKAFLIGILWGIAFFQTSAQSGFPVFAFDSYGRWGYCYQGTDFVIPCYDNVVDLGPSRAAFWAQQNGLWGLRRLDNSEILPFMFDDVCVASQFQPNPSVIDLDSIVMFDRGTILPSLTLIRDYHYQYPSSVPLFFPLLPVEKDGKWGYVDFRGETVIPFEYDEAFIFTLWLANDEKRSNWLAEVRKDGQSAWINMFGIVIIPWQQSRTFSVKEAKSYLDKRKKFETELYNHQIDFLANRMDSVLLVGDYVNQFDEDINVVEVKGKAALKPRYRVLYEDGTPVVRDTVDFVFEREGDALRVKTDNGMLLVNLNTGESSAYYDSIAPVDTKGQALAWSGTSEYRIGLHGSWAPRNHSYRKYLAEIQSSMRQGNYDDAAKEVYSLSSVMPYYGSPWYRYACDATIRKVANVYNYEYDPVAIAERERRAAEKKAERQSNWSLLGDLLSVAGSFTDGETSQGLKAVGESIKVVADPNSASAEADDQTSAEVEAAASAQDVSLLQAQVNAIDEELEQISLQQAQLAKDRLQTKRQVVAAGALGAKVQTGSNATRNFSPPRARRQAQQRAKAQAPVRNQMSSIDNQLERLNNRKAELLAQRSQLNQQINELSGIANDYSDSESSSSKSKERKVGNMAVHTFSLQEIQSVWRQLRELKDKAGSEGLTDSDLSRVRSLKAQAKRIRKNCLEQSGQTLPDDAIEDWNPKL